MTLYGWAAKQTIPLFWRETKQRPELEISTRPEVGKGTPVRSWKKEPRGSDGRRRGAVDSRHRTSERPVAWDRVQQQWGKTSQDELAFLVALWKFREGCMSALVYRCTKECRVSQLNVLALELTQPHIVRFFFVLFSHSVDCISCAVKKCVIPLSEPLDDSLAKTWNGFKKWLNTWGPRGY